MEKINQNVKEDNNNKNFLNMFLKKDLIRLK